MAKICSYGGCKAIVTDGTYRCQKHPVVYTPKATHPDWKLYNLNKRVYDTPRWKRVSRLHRDQNPLCVHCLRLNITTPAACVDHVIEISDGGEIWDTKNHESLCNLCHSIKTGRELRKRNRKKQLNGFNQLSDF